MKRWREKHADEFPLAIWQTGSARKANTQNMNEVLANRASEILGGVRSTWERKLHPNDGCPIRVASNGSQPPRTWRRYWRYAKHLKPAIIRINGGASSINPRFRRYCQNWPHYLQDARRRLTFVSRFPAGSHAGT